MGLFSPKEKGGSPAKPPACCPRMSLSMDAFQRPPLQHHHGVMKGTVPTWVWLIPKLCAQMLLVWEDTAEKEQFLLQSKWALAHFCVQLPPAKAMNTLVGLWQYSPWLESPFLAEGENNRGCANPGEACTPLLDSLNQVPSEGTALPGSAPTCPAALKLKDWKCRLHTLSYLPSPLKKG